MYLAIGMDLFSRRTIGWVMKLTLVTKIDLDVALMAVWRRNSKQNALFPGQGSQYSSGM